jgi:hypothetical protein
VVISNATLSVTFSRPSEGALVAMAVRGDGVTVRVKGVGQVHPLPHDLAHWVVERELDLRRGFWASVAAGAVFNSMAVVGGRRRPHADERSRAVIKVNGPCITQAEVVVGSFMRIIERGLDDNPQVAMAFLRDEQSAVPAGVLAVERDALVRVCAALRAAAVRWQALPVGASLTDSWTVPETVGLRSTARERRRLRPRSVRRAARTNLPAVRGA